MGTRSVIPYVLKKLIELVCSYLILMLHAITKFRGLTKLVWLILVFYKQQMATNSIFVGIRFYCCVSFVTVKALRVGVMRSANNEASK